MKTTRRSFFKRTLALAAGVLALPAFSARAWAKKLAIRLEKVPKLAKVGGWSILKVKDRQIMFIRTAEDDVKAFDPICTHQKCLVAYNPDTKLIDCGCHKSSYDMTGKVLGGPAPAPLPTFPAKLSKGRIIVTVD